jgi:hypothetical protein
MLLWFGFHSLHSPSAVSSFPDTSHAEQRSAVLSRRHPICELPKKILLGKLVFSYASESEGVVFTSPAFKRSAWGADIGFRAKSRPESCRLASRC